MTGFSRPGVTSCLPQDARLIRDPQSDDIAEDVDELEMTNYVAIALLVIELIFASVTLTALCVKQASTTTTTRTTPGVARVANYRNSVYEGEIDAIRI